MNRSFRLLSGILALIAMSFSLGEGLWAATCAPMDAGGRAALSILDPGEAAVAECAPSRAGDTGEDDGAGCPFGSLATSGSCLSAAALSPSAESLPGSPRLSDPLVAARSHSDLLLETSLYRPPRA